MKKLFLILSLSIALFSCKDEGDVGLSLQDPDDLVGTFLLDTATMEANTVLYKENLRTDSGNFLLVGSYNDEYVGKVTTNTFFELLPSDDETPGTNPKCDSIVLTLGFARNSDTEARSFGDTLTTASYYLYKTTEDIEDRIYSPSESVGIEATQIASLENTTFKPLTDSAIIFSLDKTLGDNLLAQWTEDNTMGFSVQSSDENSAVFAIAGLSTRTGITIYYSNESGSGFFKKMTIQEGGTDYFNQILTDRNATKLASLVNEGDLVSDSETDGNVFLQNGTGLAVNINIPSLQSIVDSLKGATIHRAELSFSIRDNTYTGASTRPPIQNFLFEGTDNLPVIENGDPKEIFLDRVSSSIFVPNLEDKTYTIQLTSYVQELVLGEREVTPFFLQANDDAASVARSVICGPSCIDESKRPKLTIYYIK